MALLPRLITMMFNSSFFQYETQEGQYHATVRARSHAIVSEKNFTKFEVVSSRVRGMVHIRTCYNKKFLQLGERSNIFLYATADEPEEDRSKRSCTLFRFVISGDRVGFHLQSQNVERPVVVYDTGSQIGGLGVASGHTATMLRFRDMTSLAILPKHVLFKGDDGNYLRARKRGWLAFVANDPMDWRVHHISTLVPNTGDVRLLSPRFDLYWQRTNNDWLRCDASQSSLENSTFRPVRQSSSSQGNTIALLNTTNNRYCERWTSGRNAGYVRASALTVRNNAVLTVEEAIRDRAIFDIRYHINDAGTYDMVPIQSITKIVNNNGDTDATTTVEFSYTQVMEEMFTSSHSWKLSVKTTVTVMLIPKIVQGKLTTNAAYSGKVEWSKMKRTEKRVNTSIVVTVPARSVIRVTLIVGQGFMNVPFSYKQRDILMDGTSEVKDMHDGLFSGLNSYEFRYDIGRPESLLSSTNLPTGHDDIVIVPGESMDLPRMAISRVVDELKVEGEHQGEEEPIPMEEVEDHGGEGEGELVPLPSKL